MRQGKINSAFYQRKERINIEVIAKGRDQGKIYDLIMDMSCNLNRLGIETYKKSGERRDIDYILKDLTRLCERFLVSNSYNKVEESICRRTDMLTGIKLGADGTVNKIPPISKNDIKLVNFNEQKGITVIKWCDNTVTKVRLQKETGDTWNPELGLAMCICKKALGNKGNFNDVFNNWLPKDTE